MSRRREHEDEVASLFPEHFERDRVGPEHGVYPVPLEGRTTTMATRVSEMTANAVESALHNPRCPFERPSDFIRWCIVVGTEKLARAMADERALVSIGRIKAFAVLARQTDEDARFDTALDKLESAINTAQRWGVGEQERRLAEFIEQLKELPDDELRERLMERIRQRYPALLPGVARLLGES